ncbi:NAD-dependent epimerase/dehydratase family protein [Vibrio splendidus]|uniref:NAD-dependent epimerase/dehydratase family protein n=1 Tax=Vibrio splendidus TaxID=29497 RepID=UPI002235B36F|nr:NAD-dependent epimerase/dehydratase family protein [Vibrio splendidus]MCW4442364.1 NAD-dependent epimerase/dehydratase family protein [Vibrio splendidus]
MNILLTGSNGFIGSNFIDMCTERDSFRFVYRSLSQVDPKLNLLDNIEPYILNSGIDSQTDWGCALNNIDTVIHLAGLAHGRSSNPDDYHRVNTEGTLKLATKAYEAGVKRFVYVSSIGVLGSSTEGGAFDTCSSPTPLNYYAVSKYNAELGLKGISKKTGLEIVIIRPTLVYGLGAPGNFGLLSKFIKIFPILPFGLADNRRDFIAVQNLVDFLFVCASHPKANGQTFLASDGRTLSIREFTNAIAIGLGKRVVQLPVPLGFMRLLGRVLGKSSIIEQLYGDLQVDSSLQRELLGWVAPFSVEQAMTSLSGTKK